MTKYLALIQQFHWTIDNIIMVVLGIFLVEGLRILGRSSAPTTTRTHFSLSYWLSQTNNWLSPLVSVGCSLALLAFGPSKSTYLSDNAMEFAFVAGAFGQAIIKVLINGVRGTLGQYGRASQPPPQP